MTALERADARVHRCGGCGAWVYGRRACKTPTCREVPAARAA